MRPEQLDALYAEICNALARVGEEKASLFLATLSLDLLAHHPDLAAAATAAISRAERLSSI